jgi:hypothetical protein
MDDDLDKLLGILLKQSKSYAKDNERRGIRLDVHETRLDRLESRMDRLEKKSKQKSTPEQKEAGRRIDGGSRSRV